MTCYRSFEKADIIMLDIGHNAVRSAYGVIMKVVSRDTEPYKFVFSYADQLYAVPKGWHKDDNRYGVDLPEVYAHNTVVYSTNYPKG